VVGAPAYGLGVGEMFGGGGLGGASLFLAGLDGDDGVAADVGDSDEEVAAWCAGAVGELSSVILDRPEVKSLRSSSFSVLRAKQKSET